MEIMIAMALTSIVTTAVLAIVRIQMRMFEMNDQVVRTQENARAAMDFLETMARRACGAVSSGAIGVNVAGVTQATVPCRATGTARPSAPPASPPAAPACPTRSRSSTARAP
jgi:Tfp pilus assembly protein PilW